MAQLLAEYLLVIFWSGVKFLVGVGLSLTLQHSFLEQLLLTTGGGILGTSLLTYFGNRIKGWLRRWYVRRRQARGKPLRTKTPKKPPSKLVVWATQRFGLMGIAFLTPPLLSPPIGVPLALALTSDTRKIALYMALAMVFWALVFAFAGPPVVQWFERLWQHLFPIELAG
ncbi:MAG: hypothetical protein SFY70_10140 [Bacteroidia bacterium]|nr:hypothetical protein [Bacteroidia bacterium]